MHYLRMNTMSSISAMTKKMTKPPSWSAMGSGVSGQVSAIYALDVNNVYVGGLFNTATNTTGTITVNNIAKWDGNNWTALGTGVSGGDVRAIYAVDANNVYVGGDFTSAGNNVTGSITVNRIAKWDGNNWSALGNNGVNKYVTSIYALNTSNVYVAGNFTSAGSVSVVRVAKWDGNTWTPMGTSGTNGVSGGDVRAIYAYGTDIYIGGSFTNQIAKWDGSSSWIRMNTSLGQSISGGVGVVNAIYAYQNNVYVAGDFYNLNNIDGTYFIAKWDGNNWSPVGNTGTNGIIYAIRGYENNVYIGGSFNTVRGVNGTNYIAKWDGSTWTTMGTSVSGGTSTMVNAIYALGENNVYAGGSFTTAGGLSVNNIAVWK